MGRREKAIRNKQGEEMEEEKKDRENSNKGRREDSLGAAGLQAPC